MKNFVKILFIFLIISIVACGGPGEKKTETTTKPGETPNTPPFIRKITLLPENPILGSRLDLRIEAGDNEGDQISYAVKWFLNSKEIGQGVEFYLHEAKRGDSLYAQVMPSDGKASGEPGMTPVVIIGNSPPKITSARITPDAILSSTDDLTVIGEGRDPDGDPIRWVCYWVLNYAKRIADSALTINVKNLKLKKGSHLTAELYAYDGDTVSTPYLLEIAVANAPPVLREGVDSVPFREDSLLYALPIVDPDGDPLKFEILKAPAGVKIDSKKGIIYGVVQETEPFEVLVRALDNDGAYLDAKFTLTPPKP